MILKKIQTKFYPSDGFNFYKVEIIKAVNVSKENLVFFDTRIRLDV